MNAPEHVTPPPNASAVALLPIAEITPSLSNPRKHFDEAYLAELAESMKAHGVIQPITVRPLAMDTFFDYNKRRKAGDESLPPQYEIVVGECRWRAAKLAGLTEIPGFWRELDDKQVLEIQVVENLQRRDVHPIEEAEGYQALIARHGYSADEIAAKIGKSRAYVYARLKLTALVPAVRETFFAGKLEASTALLIARIPGEALQKRAAKEVTESYNGEPLSYRAAKNHIHSRYTLSLKQATFKPDDATLLPAAGACSACPKLSGNFQDLFNDIEDADVCTDPDCFEAKRLARREQLLALAEKKKIPVLTGDAGREAWHGREYITLDSTCYDDADRRSYREILGDQAPVPAVLVEKPFGDKELCEAITGTAMEKALKKAGWAPAASAPAKKNETPEQKAKREAEEKKQAERRATETQRAEQAEQETERREAALVACWPKLHATTLDTDKTTEDLLYLVGEAWLRAQASYLELADFEDDIREHIDPGFTLPDEYDDAPQLERAISLLRAAPLSRVMAMILASSVYEESKLRPWDLDADNHVAAAPFILAPLTRLLDVPFESLTHPISPPINAARAGDISATAAPAEATAETPAKAAKKPAPKKAKAKADPAPASPANEAAAPPKTSAEGLHPMMAWPFPQGARA